jgi:hypothetical protein
VIITLLFWEHSMSDRRGSSTISTAQVDIPTTGATLLVAFRQSRGLVTLLNADGANPIYWGPAGVTASTGFALSAGASITLSITAEIYAIATGGTVKVHVAEAFA